MWLIIKVDLPNKFLPKMKWLSLDAPFAVDIYFTQFVLSFEVCKLSGRSLVRLMFPLGRRRWQQWQKCYALLLGDCSVSKL